MQATRATARIGLTGCLVIAAALAAGAARADDRDFVRKSAENPYVFILLDVSGSMNWTTKCTQDQLNAGDCRKLCADGDCFANLNADDPASKFYQAKEALYEVLSQVSGLQLGFATYNQDGLYVPTKHWLYQSTSPGVTLGDGSKYPPVGAQEAFGRTWNCSSGAGGQDSVGCDPTTPAPLNDPWSVQRMQRLAKLGDTLSTNVSFYISTGGTTYQVTYSPLGGTLGAATLRAHVDVRSCTFPRRGAPTCTTPQGAADVDYSLVDQFLSWDVGANSVEAQQGFFPQGASSDSSASNTCSGWDDNTPPEAGSADPHSGYDLRWPTTATDPRGSKLYVGDMVPLDWQNDHKADILHRLAPTVGAYDTAPYFEDHPRAGEDFLRLVSDNNRPLIPFGATPLGDSIKSFRTWYAGCAQGSCPRGSGWRDIAAAQDPNWGCRKKYLIVLTDGDETCGGGNSACSGTASLKAQEDILTYVVAFGVQGGGNTLTCMAANGGTGSPIYPQNKGDLVRALTDTLSKIKEEERSFASAAVPSVEANVADKIFLSDFTPISGAPIWDGHFDAYLKPLPVKADGTPDASRACSASVTSGCHLWDAGDQLETQAPTAAEAAAGNYKLGLNASQRRVYYPDASGALHVLQPPTADSDWLDFFRGLGFRNATDLTQLGANKSRATDIVANTLAIKTATVNTAAGSFNVSYVLGDVFHADPVVIEEPHDFDDFAADTTTSPCRLNGSNHGYKCFAFQQQFRRKQVLIGTNDAQLHGIDGGTFDSVANKFSNGTGNESFSFIPRMALPILRDDAEGAVHIYGIDGAAAIGDSLLADGDWHTLAVGGLREGGRKLGGALVQQPEAGGTNSEQLRGGYYALDISQPDPLREEFDRNGNVTRFVPTTTGVVPGCATMGGAAPPGCPRTFPSLLWEFRDLSPASGQSLDENRNGQPDLGAPWSKPVLTRIKLQGLDANGRPAVLTRFVVVVGGGLDPASKSSTSPASGNFVYILDAGTGRVIYKHEVEGSVPAVAVLDRNNDNVADYIYAGTTAGRVYKIDLTTAQPLVDVTVQDRYGATTTVQRVTASAWNPLQVFRTGEDTPIYQQIQVLFLSRLGRFALVFGTGDREDLWAPDTRRGRTYVLVDDNWSSSTTGLPFNESAYQQITPDGADLLGNPNLFLAPQGGKLPGWYMLLSASERAITKPFGVSGILIFSTFIPQVVVETEGHGSNAETFCTRSGESHNFVVYTFNGNAVANMDDDPALDKYLVRPDFVSAPFVEQAYTQNTKGGEPPPSTAEKDASCTDNVRLQEIVAKLKVQGPTDARYGNYFLRLGQRLSKRGMLYPACVPIAVMQKNWKEN